MRMYVCVPEGVGKLEEGEPPGRGARHQAWVLRESSVCS